MAYGDYNGPNKPNKGHEGGSCNRTRCQSEPALHFNHGSRSWYCWECSIDIGQDRFNKTDWDKHHPEHPMFETREQMNLREKL